MLTTNTGLSQHSGGFSGTGHESELLRQPGEVGESVRRPSTELAPGLGHRV